MAALPWTQYTEAVVGLNHPTLLDTDNRALRALLTQSGYNPDASPFPGLLGPVFNVRAFGAVGDGSTDDTAAIVAALAAANAASGGEVYCPRGTYKITATLAIPANTKLCGQGPQRTIIRRAFNGTMMTVTAVSDVELSSLTLDGGAPTFAGKGVVISGAGSSLRPYFSNIWSISMGSATDTHLEFGADAGSLAIVHGWTMRLGNGTLDFRGIHTNGPDTVFMGRSFGQVNVGNGYVDFSGAIDTTVALSTFERIETTSTTSILLVTGCVWANLGVAMTLNGSVMNVMGCRFSGSVTLSTTYLGAFIGNILTDTSYTFTNNSTLNGSFVQGGVLSDSIIRLYQDLQLQGRLKFSTAASAIVPGVTSLNFLDNAGSFTNLGITDAGAVTVPRGALSVGANTKATETDIDLNSAAATQQQLRFKRANVLRWVLLCEADAESGSDAGSTLKIIGYTDAGAAIDTPIQIVRAAGGAMSITRPFRPAVANTVALGTAALPFARSYAQALVGTLVNMGTGSSFTPDVNTGSAFIGTANAAATVNAPTNAVTGQRIAVTIIQDGTGGRTVAWNAVFKQSWSDAGNTLNKRSSIAFVYDGTSWNQDGAQTPYV